MRFFSVFEKFFVKFVEVLFGVLLVGENFYDFLTVYVFLYKAFFFSERNLLGDHVLCTFSADFFDYEEHRKRTYHEYESKYNAVIKH